jgi:hypothetical protein
MYHLKFSFHFISAFSFYLEIHQASIPFFLLAPSVQKIALERSSWQTQSASPILSLKPSLSGKIDLWMREEASGRHR